jgi:glycosyltransferase involved in cell wall biosynthesis
MVKISLVIPVYNEIDVLPELFQRLQKLDQARADEVLFNFIFVNDGSNDGSKEYLRVQAELNKKISLISLSRNFGHQIAVSAGLDHSNGDYVGIIDADLQDPPELIYDMYEVAKREGCDVVYGQRVSRKGETFFKKATAKYFYILMNRLCDIEIPRDTGDFRIITGRVAEILKMMPEKHRYIRGLVPWIGFRSIAFKYERNVRAAGVTKYPLMKMFQFAFNAILSFSRKPITIGLMIGGVTVFMGALLAIIIISLKLFTNIVVPGLASTLVLITIFSGVQILLTGIIGEYVGRIYEEVKGRPLYIVEEKINANAGN